MRAIDRARLEPRQRVTGELSERPSGRLAELDEFVDDVDE